MASYITNQKIVLTSSGARCSMPNCDRILVEEKTDNDPEALLALTAHINGRKPGSPRYDPDMTNEERDCPSNLMAVCGVCHKIVDSQECTYTVEELRKIKNKHETWVKEQTLKNIPLVSFIELKQVTNYVVSHTDLNDDTRVTPPKDKIDKNHLSAIIENLIKMGLSNISLVKDYIKTNIDTEFGEKLKKGFVDEYERLRNKENLIGDELFESLMRFANQGNIDFPSRAAGLCVLCYFFESCDIFKK